MRSRLVSALTVLGAVAALVLVANGIAVAANGQPFLLGANNSASNATKLTRANGGAALNLATGPNSAPLIVNGKGKVKNLNADRVDGYSATDLRPTSRIYTRDITSATSAFSMYAFPAPGVYLVSYSVFLKNGSSSAGVLDCWVSDDTGVSKFMAEEVQRYNTGDAVGVSGSGVIRISGNRDVKLHCDNTTGFTTFASQPIQLVLTKTAVGYSGDARHSTFRTGVGAAKK